MNLYRISLMFLSITILFACKNDSLQDYKMEDAEFITTARQELIFQKHLIQVLQKSANQNLVNIGNRRSLDTENYLKALQSKSKPEHWNAAEVLNQEYRSYVDALKAANQAEQKLFAYLVRSDQNLIGVHVRAVSPEGLKNAELRNWADLKINYLQNNLRESQDLKP